MNRHPIESFIQDRPLVAIGIVVIVIGLLVGLGTMVYQTLTPKPKPAMVAVVEFNDGQNTVTVERTGKVTIKTPFGTFTQQWDKEKIRQFFEQIDDLDFDLLSKFLGLSLAMDLTLANGEQITIYLTEAQDGLTQAIQESLEQIYSDEGKDTGPLPTLIPLVLNSPSPSPRTSVTPQPSVTTSGGKISGGNNPFKQGTEVEDPTVFNCDTALEQTGKRVVISNTLCEK